MANNLTEYIQSIIDQTSSGQIRWQKQSDVVFDTVVKGANKQARMILQKVYGLIAGGHIVFRVIDLRTNQDVININGASKGDMVPILARLFAAADKNVDSYGADFLKDLLG